MMLLRLFISALADGVFGTVPKDVSPKRDNATPVRTGAQAAGTAFAELCGPKSTAVGFCKQKESRASRMAAREKPGGEPPPKLDVAADGVPGIVSNGVIPKRQRLPKRRCPSLLDMPEELSASEALLCPTSVVASSSAASMFNSFCNEIFASGPLCILKACCNESVVFVP